MGWWWIGIFLLLLVAGLAVLGAMAWGLVKQGFALVGDLGAAAERLGELTTQVESLPAVPRESAVFDDPAELRRQRTERLRRLRRTRARARSRSTR